MEQKGPVHTIPETENKTLARPPGRRKEQTKMETNEFETTPKSTFWRDWGVYCALALCLAVIGAAVAITSLPKNQEAVEPQDVVAAAEPLPEEEETVPVILPVRPEASSLPVLRILSTPTPAPTATATAAPTPTPKAASADKKAAAPVSGKVVWGYAQDKLIYSKTLDQWTTHLGVDIACLEGTTVKCVLGGTVEKVYTDDALGTTVIVAHSSDRKSLYANLNDTVPVQAGDKVNAGTVLGTVGHSAISECAEESHLHFAFFQNGKAVDPATKVKIG